MSFGVRSRLVDGLSPPEVASKAGVDPEYVDLLVELGFMTPGDGDTFSSGDVLRARWIRSLEQAGVPLDGMAAAVRDGALSFSYLDMSAFDRFAGLSSTTFQRLSDETGIPFDLLSVVREALGYPEPKAEDYVREDELSVIGAVEFQLSKGFRPIMIERWLRVYGDSFRRIAETETDAYRREVVVPLLETGMSEREMLDVQAHLGSEMGPLIERALLAIYHGHQERTWTRVWMESVEGALEKAGLHSQLHSQPAVSFLDLTGYTQLTEEHGDEAAADLAGRLRDVVRQTSLTHEGESVKFLGDGVMFYFPNPTNSVLAALDMVERAATKSLPPARVGIHAGPVVFQEGDYFGRTVNIAARITDYSRPGEVLVSRDVVDSASADGLSFTQIGPVTLKGVAGPIHLYRAHRQTPPADRPKVASDQPH
jgi:adenylate cyclase